MEMVRGARGPPICSTEQKRVLFKLQIKGNFLHIIEAGVGELVLARRPVRKDMLILLWILTTLVSNTFPR